MKVGQGSYLLLAPINLVPTGCSVSAQTDGPYVSSNPAVASVERGPVLRAVSAGSALIYADMGTPGGSVRASLSLKVVP
jgi:hypothetical protein